MKRNIRYIIGLCLILLGISCSDTIPVSKETSEKPVLFPDYADVTIPYNIAPLNFKIQNPHTEAFVLLKFGEEKIQVKEKGGTVLSSHIRLEKIVEKRDRKSDTSKALRQR